jgi:hypothetical protein
MSSDNKSDGLSKISAAVDKIVSEKLDTSVSVLSGKIDKLETKNEYRTHETNTKIAYLENELKHVKEALEQIKQALVSDFTVKSESKVAKAAAPKATKAKTTKASTGLEPKSINTIVDFCSWKWTTDSEFKDKYATEENMAEINKVANVKNTKDPQKKAINEGKAFYNKVVVKSQKSGDSTLSKEIEDQFNEFRKQFEELTVDDSE